MGGGTWCGPEALTDGWHPERASMLGGEARRRGMFGCSVGPQSARRSEAVRGLAKEIACPGCVYAAQDENQMTARDFTLYEGSLTVPSSWSVEVELARVVGLCDIVYRTALTSVGDVEQHWPVGWAREGAPVSRGPHFEAACACFRPATDWCLPPTDFFAPPLPPNGVLDGSTDAPFALSDTHAVDGSVEYTLDFDAFTAAAQGKDVPPDAYGVAGDILRLKATVVRSFSYASNTTRELSSLITRRSNVLVRTRSVEGEALATTLVTRYIDSLASASERATTWQRIEARATALKSAWSSLSLLKARVKVHIDKRVAADRHHLEELSEDALATVVRHLSPTAASSLMRTCRGFRDATLLHDRLPHLRIRHVDGAFPHGRVISRDRADLAKSINKPVMRAFVVKRNAVRIYVDFIVNTIRQQPLKKLPRKDGLCNEDHDFSDDEYEQAPERAGPRGPQPDLLVAPLDPVITRRQIEGSKRRRAAWEAGNGPLEKLDRFAYDQRIYYPTYFRALPVMTPSLVFADDHSAVPCTVHKSALVLSNATRARGCTFSQPRRKEVPYEVTPDHPASVRFHVGHLSQDHGDRLFKIKVVAEATFNDGAKFERSLYSEAFECVGKIQAIDKAAKRGVAADARTAKAARR